MVKSEIWVKAHIRRCSSEGLGAVIVNKGAPEAGAVYVMVTIETEKVRVFAPAPGPTYDEFGARNWVCPLGEDPVSQEVAEKYLQRQLSFDPDIWIIDIDDRTGSGLLQSQSC